MCVHAKALNDDCLLAIFKRIPLAQLLRLDQVSPRWAVLLPLACVQRRTLVLILGGRELDRLEYTIPFNDRLEIPIDGGKPYYGLSVVEKESAIELQYLLPKSPNNSFDEFLVDGCEESEGFFDMLYRPDGPHLTEIARFRDAHLSGQLGTYLADLFPRVNTLVVIHYECYEDELHSLVGLLGSSSWSLVTLNLWLRTKDIDERYVGRRDQHPVGTLLRAVNKLPLQQLTCDIRGDSFIGAQEPPEFTFPVESFAFIAHLKVVKLCLHYYVSNNSIWENVHRYDSAQLSQIEIGTLYNLEAALRPQFEFVRKVRQLYWFDWFTTVDLLGPMCLPFTSLTTLELFWSGNITFTELVANLALLRQMTHLVMYIYSELNPANLFTLVDRDEGDGEQEEQPRPISLPQVKILQLVIRKRDHHDFESFSPSVFPSVELIILTNLQFVNGPKTDCAICRPNITGQHDTQVAKRCFQLMARSLRNKFANPSVRMYADGSWMQPDSDSGFESFKTKAILFAVLVGLPFVL